MLAHLKQWWLTHSLWIFAAAQFFYPSVNEYVHKHPGTFFGTILAIVIARLTQGQSQQGGSR